MPQNLKSRKLWAAIVGVLLNLLTAAFDLDLDDDTLNRINTAIIAYLGAQGIVDAVSARNNITVTHDEI